MYILNLYIENDVAVSMGSESAPFVPRQSDIIVIEGEHYTVLEVQIEYHSKTEKTEISVFIERV